VVIRELPMEARRFRFQDYPRPLILLLGSLIKEIGVYLRSSAACIGLVEVSIHESRFPGFVVQEDLEQVI
jgi:hypothetical protein